MGINGLLLTTLSILEKHKSMTGKEIKQRLDVNDNWIYVLLKEMEEKKLIKKKVKGRTKDISITPLGKKYLYEIIG